jgi:hypothetical protein
MLGKQSAKQRNEFRPLAFFSLLHPTVRRRTEINRPEGKPPPGRDRAEGKRLTSMFHLSFSLSSIKKRKVAAQPIDKEADREWRHIQQQRHPRRCCGRSGNFQP